MPADVTSLPVEFLFTMKATLTPPAIVANGPQGTRVIVNVTGGTVSGPKVNGTLLASGGDWVTMRASGSGLLDVRLTITTDDGATIFMEYKGILKDGVVRTAPLFQTGDERYAWLNDAQCVAIGAPGKGEVTYDVYVVQ
jgi:hypothetical protein